MSVTAQAAGPAACWPDARPRRTCSLRPRKPGASSPPPRTTACRPTRSWRLNRRRARSGERRLGGSVGDARTRSKVAPLSITRGGSGLGSWRRIASVHARWSPPPAFARAPGGRGRVLGTPAREGGASGNSWRREHAAAGVGHPTRGTGAVMSSVVPRTVREVESGQLCWVGAAAEALAGGDMAAGEVVQVAATDGSDAGAVIDVEVEDDAVEVLLAGPAVSRVGA